MTPIAFPSSSANSASSGCLMTCAGQTSSTTEAGCNRGRVAGVAAAVPQPLYMHPWPRLLLFWVGLRAVAAHREGSTHRGGQPSKRGEGERPSLLRREQGHGGAAASAEAIYSTPRARLTRTCLGPSFLPKRAVMSLPMVASASGMCKLYAVDTSHVRQEGPHYAMPQGMRRWQPFHCLHSIDYLMTVCTCTLLPNNDIPNTHCLTAGNSSTFRDPSQKTAAFNSNAACASTPAVGPGEGPRAAAVHQEVHPWQAAVAACKDTGRLWPSSWTMDIHTDDCQRHGSGMRAMAGRMHVSRPLPQKGQHAISSAPVKCMRAWCKLAQGLGAALPMAGRE